MAKKKERIGEVIRGKRKRLGLQAEIIAAHCNVSRGRVYQWEQNGYILPKNLPALSLVLNIPMKRLLAANGSRARSQPVSRQSSPG